MATKRKAPTAAGLGVSKLLTIEARQHLTDLDATAAPAIVHDLRRQLTRADRVQAFHILPRLLALTLARRLAALELTIRTDVANGGRDDRRLRRLADQIAAARLEVYERAGIAGN